MSKIKDNQETNKSSRIFSTTENPDSSISNAEADIQYWTCRKCHNAYREEDDMWCEHCIKGEKL